MALFHLRAELQEDLAVRFGLALRRRNAVGAVGDACRTAIPMVDRDHPVDLVQLERGTEIVPKRLVPGFELWRHDPDRRAGDDKLAVAPGQPAPVHIFVDRRHHPRVDAGEQHRLVFGLRRRDTGEGGGEPRRQQKMAAAEGGGLAPAMSAHPSLLIGLLRGG